jgi:hypothetical protein
MFNEYKNQAKSKDPQDQTDLLMMIITNKDHLFTSNEEYFKDLQEVFNLLIDNQNLYPPVFFELCYFFREKQSLIIEKQSNQLNINYFQYLYNNTKFDSFFSGHDFFIKLNIKNESFDNDIIWFKDFLQKTTNNDLLVKLSFHHDLFVRHCVNQLLTS